MVSRNPDGTVAQWLRGLIEGLDYDLIGPLMVVVIVAAMVFAAIVWYRNRAEGTSLSRRWTHRGRTARERSRYEGGLASPPHAGPAAASA